MIDICDFAVGLSRQLHGLTIASERPGHRLMETWHPMGPCAVITAFNFPVAVWSWNAALALVARRPGDLEAVGQDAAHRARLRRAARSGRPPTSARRTGLNQVLLGGADVGAALAAHDGVADRVGHRLDARWAAPSRRSSPAASAGSILELGGNNAAIVAPSADLELAVRGIAFSAVGTAGQRCTSLRRLIVHRLGPRRARRAARPRPTPRVPIGDPLADGTLVGPLIDAAAVRPHAGGARRPPATTAARSSSAASGCSPTRRPTPSTSSRRSWRCRRRPRSCAPRRSGRCSTCSRYDDLDEADRPAQRRAAGPGVEHLHQRRARGRAVHVGRRLATAASPTSTSARRAPRSAAPSAARRRPAAAASPAPTPGRRYMRRATNTVNYSSVLPLAQGVHVRHRHLTPPFCLPQMPAHGHSEADRTEGVGHTGPVRST